LSSYYVVALGGVAVQVAQVRQGRLGFGTECAKRLGEILPHLWMGVLQQGCQNPHGPFRDNDTRQLADHRSRQTADQR
jgi:hypothetical protein